MSLIPRITLWTLALILTALVAGCDGGGGGPARRTPGLPGVDPDDAAGQLPPGGGGAPAERPADLPALKPGGQYLLGLGTRIFVDPYVPDAPLRAAMLHCTVTLREGEECNLEQLPLLGMTREDPTVDDVMARVLVSHAWMGVHFRELLEALPPHMLQLMRPLTTIVISYDIRPSFYTTWTGAIYLDPEDLWLTQEERAVIDTEPDYRSGFGSALGFTTLWRYVRDNEYATRLPSEGTRTIEEIKYAMASLLYHELAHANDYFYPGKNLLGVMQVPLRRAASGTIPSRNLASQYPLRSNLLFGLGRVRYHGVTASNAQKSYTPADVAAEFENDYANAFYSYASEREDLAMLFEELMMLYSFDIDRDVAVTNLPDTNSCVDYLVTWGERNRILTSAVANRALYITQRVLPEAALQVQTFLAEHPATPRMMTPGIDWCANRYLDAPTDSRALTSELPGPVKIEPIAHLLPYL